MPIHFEPRQHRVAHVEQGQAGELDVQVVGGAHQIVGVERGLDVDRLLGDLAVACHHDDEHALGAERHELDALENRAFVGRHGEAHHAGGAGDDVRHVGEEVAHERRALGLLSQPDLDGGRRLGGPAALEQLIDEDAIGAVGGHTAGRRVRLVDEARLFKLSQDVAHRGRRHAEAALAREHLRRHGFAGLDVLANQRGQQPARPIGEFKRTHWFSGAYSL